MKQATTYSKAIKESFLAKTLAPNAPSVVKLAEEFKALLRKYIFLK